jgi:hypothetical protein
MTLLAELSTLKELNRQYEANPQQADEAAQRLRAQRHEEITREIQALSEQKKNSKSASK